MPVPLSSNPRWDPWVLFANETYYLFYLSGRTDQDPWWKTSWICGGYSQDFCQWQHTGPVLKPSPDEAWESGRIFAGSTYKVDDVYYLFYSAASESSIDNEAIGIATSVDGKHWQRKKEPLLSWHDSHTPHSARALGYAGRCDLANHLHWRDPYIVQSAQDNKYYLFFCASMLSADSYQGGLGVAVSDHINGPYQLLPPAAGPKIDDAREGSFPSISQSLKLTEETDERSRVTETDLWPFYHLERPQIIFFRGQYHLFFSCFKHAINPHWLEQIGTERVSDSTLYWYVADEITGPFRPTSDLPVVAGSELTGLYGTTFFPLEKKGDWSQVARENTVTLSVLGWYHQDYRLEINQEFLGVWNDDGLQLIANKGECLKG